MDAETLRWDLTFALKFKTKMGQAAADADCRVAAATIIQHLELAGWIMPPKHLPNMVLPREPKARTLN